MAKRVILFLLTNLAITFVLGIVLNIIFKVKAPQVFWCYRWCLVFQAL